MIIHWWWCSVFLSLLIHISCSKEDLPPGHMMPLGSHMTPKMVLRSSHLPRPREFSEKYVIPKIPVLFEGAMNNSLTWKNWHDDQYIREHFGDILVGIEVGKKENRSDPRYQLTIDEFLNRYEKEDIYFVDNLPLPMYQEWQLPRPLLCEDFLDKLMYANIWFSSGGTRSVLHTDSFENLHCLVSGRKEFILIEPQYINVIGPEHEKKGYYDVDVEKVDMNVYPELAKIPWIKATVNEGDCLYVPYQWIHNVNSYGRNMGVNIWWMNISEINCSSDESVPEYLPLGEMKLSPEMIVVEALERVARQDRSVHADDLHKLLHKITDGSDINLEDVHKFLDILQPGCNGVITDYKHLARARIEEANEFIMRLFDTSNVGDGGGDELYDPQGEFGGQGMMGEDDPSHMTEGGGDYEHSWKDEL